VAIDDTRAAYDALRPDFDLTGSPALPMGLNLGAQFYWQLSHDPTLAARIATIVTYPQYWGYLLTGALACDVTSLGCHTDLWAPLAGRWSDLPAALGLANKFAPCLPPSAVLGTTLPALGLGEIPVLCGIHDSNASLLPHLIGRDPPFSVVSTGTWVICMAMGARAVTLDPTTDVLINVNAMGAPVPSSRFMGGRIYDQFTRGAIATPDDVAAVDRTGLILTDALEFSHPPETDGMAEVALGRYLARRTAECLDMIGAAGPTLIEGPFSANPWFLAALATITGRQVIASPSRTGTAVGAAMLFKTPL
jgi:sugar (pentulose or hexulose) kinase